MKNSISLLASLIAHLAIAVSQLPLTEEQLTPIPHTLEVTQPYRASNALELLPRANLGDIRKTLLSPTMKNPQEASLITSTQRIYTSVQDSRKKPGQNRATIQRNLLGKADPMNKKPSKLNTIQTHNLTPIIRLQSFQERSRSKYGIISASQVPQLHSTAISKKEIIPAKRLCPRGNTNSCLLPTTMPSAKKPSSQRLANARIYASKKWLDTRKSIKNFWTESKRYVKGCPHASCGIAMTTAGIALCGAAPFCNQPTMTGLIWTGSAVGVAGTALTKIGDIKDWCRNERIVASNVRYTMRCEDQLDRVVDRLFALEDPSDIQPKLDKFPGRVSLP